MYLPFLSSATREHPRCPQPYVVVENFGDNVAGLVGYVVMSEDPTPACSGGLVATIRFGAIGLGTTPIDFTDTDLMSVYGYSIPHLPYGTTVVIGASPVDETSWSTIKALYE